LALDSPRFTQSATGADMIRAAKPKLKKCRMCPDRFSPMNSMQVVCGPSCALALAKKNAAKDAEAKRKAQRRQDRERKEALLTVSDWTKKAQKAFNAYVRERDRNEPCIDCGEWGPDESWKAGGSFDAGHYLSRGAFPELRFDPMNCHKQLKSCNAGSGKYARKSRTVAAAYRERLIEKIGLAEVERLEGPHEPKRYRIEDLKQIEAHFKALTKELVKARG
tara:strand:- start:15945 stop:16607 length:663 start_codon:yes stop_codon:yes gene_type:complete